MSNNILIRASAGSGKTFQLSNRYLDIALGGAAWETVLASTFTKKAAGEILDRILIRLAEAALDDAERTKLAKFLHRPTDLPRQEVLDLLLQAVRNLHRLRVGTLDAFFIQIAGSFCLELGIPLGWQIVEEMDDQRFLTEAVREVFRQTDRSEAIRLMHLLSKGEVSQSVAKEALTLSKKLIQLFRDSPADAWKKLPRQTFTPGELDRAVELYRKAELPKHKSIEKQRTADLESIAKENWNAILNTGYAKNILKDNKYTYHTKPIEGDYKEAIDAILKHAKAELTNKLAIQTEATGELLQRVLEQYERIKEENRALRFDDITYKLSGSRLHDRLEQIVHRIDSPTHHLLLDEFQDTSPLQWEVLRPFVFAAIDSVRLHDGSFFCVGDTKQAIYGWRGGVAEIFGTIEREITPLTKESLKLSFRSAPPVIDTVNKVFQNLPHNTALVGHEDYLDAAQRWTDRYEIHETAKQELGGYCTLEIAPLYDPNAPEEPLWDESDEDSEDSDESEPGENGDQAQTTLRFAVKRIAELHRATPQATLGVLVRRNRTVGRIIHSLKKLEIHASEEGGNPLTDSPAVEMILSALTLSDHPGDTVCRFHLATGPLGPVLGLTDEKDDFQAAKIARKLRDSLLERGYGAVVAEWVAALVPSCDQRNLDRLLQLLQLAYSWDVQASIRADRFVEMVRTTKIESPSAAKIRVMTIHQSKGLQFDIVVLPELEGDLVGQSPPVVVGRKNPETGLPDPTAPVDRIVRYANDMVQAILPLPFRQMFSDYRRERVEESLCLLYVAMTRAIHRLCMILPPIKPTKTSTPAPHKTLDGILRYGLLTPDRVDVPLSVLYEYGDPDWSLAFNATHPFEEERPEPAEETAEIVLKNNVHPSRNLVRTTPSTLEGSGPKRHTPLATEKPVDGSRDRRFARLWGTAVHTCFEKAFANHPWWDRQKPDRDALIETLRESTQALSGEIEPEKIVDTFFKICEKPEIRSALSFPTTDDGFRYEVDSERDFMIRWDDGILHGSIDRLVVAYRGDKPVSAEILDYKTDAFRPAEGETLESLLSEKAAFYAPQLQAYRTAVSRLYGIAEENINATLLFTSPGRVVKIDTDLH